MKTRLILLLTITLVPLSKSLHAQGTAFTYQGRLNQSGGAANGNYDFRFRLAADALANSYVGGNVFTNGLPVSNGLFTTPLDFGAGIFNGSNYWLEIAVRTNGGASYTTLSPLQALTPAPYAIFAAGAGTVLGVVPSAGLGGSYSNAVTFNNGGNNFSGGFAGNGGGLTNVNAATLGGFAANQFWKTTGNSNTVAGVNFLGTADNQPLELWVNQSRVLRLEPGTNVYSIVGAPNAIGGAPNNFVDGGIVGATIAGGGAVNMTGFMPGPSSNHVSAIFGTIGGGRLNTVGADHGFIGGGIANTVQPLAYDAVIGGGVGNIIQTNASESVLVGGTYNSIQRNSYFSFLGGGTANSIQGGATFSVLTGGRGNKIAGTQNGSGFSTISGGDQNSIQTNGAYSTIGGGSQNTIQTNGAYSVIGGGINNVIKSPGSYATVAGGAYNTAIGSGTTIGGGYGNTSIASSNYYYATVAGGNGNTANGYTATVGGGGGNSAILEDATVAGGGYNVSSNFAATVGGGFGNKSTGDSATIAGGGFNNSSGDHATIGGGEQNTSSGSFATVGGGLVNYSTGYAATVPGGLGNQAAGSYSLAAGYSASANHTGAFVWADSQNAQFSSTANDQFSVRAVGGVRFVTGGAGMTLDGPFQGSGSGLTSLNAANISSGTLADARLSANVALLNAGLNTFAGDISLAGGTAYHNVQLSGGNALGYLYGAYNPLGDGIHLGYNFYYDAAGAGHVSNAGGATSRITVSYGSIVLAVGDVNSAPLTTMLSVTTGGICTSVPIGSCSDRNVKQDFTPVSPAEVLAKVIQLPLSEWSYTNTPAIRHVGPMAQDFYSAFNVGSDDKHIASIDEDGVALAAIQGLNQKLSEQEAALKTKDSEIQELRLAVAELQKTVRTIKNKTQE